METSSIKLDDDDLDLMSLLKKFWKRRWTILISILVSACLALAYAVTAKPLYIASVVMMPVMDDSKDMKSKLGGLSSLLGDAKADASAVNFEVLKSRNFAGLFIEKNNLMPILFKDMWDEVNNTWILKENEEPPSLSDGVSMLQKGYLSIVLDKKTAVISLDLLWFNAVDAAKLANLMAEQINEVIRKKAMSDSVLSMSYLSKQIKETKEIEVKDMLYGLMQKELQNMKLAESKLEYAFSVIDHAEVSKKPAKPRKLIILLIGLFLGTFLGFSVAFWLEFIYPKWQDIKNQLND